MGAYLKYDQGVLGKPLVEKVRSIFQFDIVPQKNAPPSSTWTIDLKNGSGEVRSGAAEGADAIFAMTEGDFEGVCLGTLNPQIAFMQGKMKIKGNMRAATKFTPELFPKIEKKLLNLSVSEAIVEYLETHLQGEIPPPKMENPSPKMENPPSKIENPPPNSQFSPLAQNLKCAKLFLLINDHLRTEAGANIVKKVGCVYRFDIIPKAGVAPISFTIDLKNEGGKVEERVSVKSDAHFTMLDEDFCAVTTGRLNPQMAYMQGRMKIKGSMRAAMKFTADLFPKRAKM